MLRATVSIIIPIYKAEAYLRKCLDSILNQTLSDFELILVDDGSPDNSGNICDEYAQKDLRIKVIHQQNGGVSVARQAGLDAANGEYTIHIDPDDWVDSTMLEELVDKARKEAADMVICDYWTEDSNGRHYVSQDPGKNLSAEIILRRILQQQLHGSCCNKLIKRTCYNGIGFYPAEITCFEDELFNIKVLNRNIIVSYLPSAYYHYRINHADSLCNAISIKTLQSRIAVVKEVEKLFSEERYDNFYQLKKDALFIAFRLKRFSDLTKLFPEINKKIINAGKNYKWYMPQTSCLSLALRGYPQWAYYLYLINMKLVSIKEKVEFILKK